MEVKKNPQCDLNCYRNLLIELGLVLALGVCLLAFEVKTKVEKTTLGNQIAVAEVETEIIPITRQEEARPPEPPPPPRVVEILNIVADDVEIEDELEIEDTEANKETFIDVSPVVKYQQTEKEAEETQVFYIVEEMPEFPGGELALRKFISNAIKYPVVAQENGVQGKVYVSFVVGKDGLVTDAKVVRGVDPALDKEAIRVVNSLPAWKPGKQRGKPVRVGFSVPISFVLQ